MSEQILIAIIILSITAHGAFAMFVTLKLNNHVLLYSFHKYLWLASIWCIPIIGVVALHFTYHVVWGGHAAQNSGVGIGAGESGGGCDGGC